MKAKLDSNDMSFTSMPYEVYNTAERNAKSSISRHKLKPFKHKHLGDISSSERSLTETSVINKP
jgi:hypothetical protein